MTPELARAVKRCNQWSRRVLEHTSVNHGVYRHPNQTAYQNAQTSTRSRSTR